MITADKRQYEILLLDTTTFDASLDINKSTRDAIALSDVFLKTPSMMITHFSNFEKHTLIYEVFMGERK